MSYMRCQHLHSEIKRYVNSRRILQQWRSLYLAYAINACQIRQAHVNNFAHVARSPKKLLSEIDQLEQQQLSHLKGKKKSPNYLEYKYKNEDVSIPASCSVIIHKADSCLRNDDYENAWKHVDTLSASELIKTTIPNSTLHLLLDALYKLVDLNLQRRLTVKYHDLQKLYTTRLDVLSNVISRRKDIYLDEIELSMLFEMYGKLGHMHRVEAIYRNIYFYLDTTSSQNLTTGLYNQLLAVYLSQFKYVDKLTCQRYFSKMLTLVENEMIRKKCLSPNMSTYNLLLAAKIKLNDLPGAQKILASCTLSRHLSPDKTTYQILLRGFLKDCLSTKDAKIARMWIDEMVQSGFRIDTRSFHSVLQGLSERIEQYARQHYPADVAITTKSLYNVYEAMLRLGHKPDTLTVNLLLKGLTAAKDEAKIETLLQSVKFPKRKEGCGNCSNCGCGSSSSSSSGHSDTQQSSAITSSTAVSIEPNEYTFATLIKYYLDKDDPNNAFKTYDAMVAANYDPNTVIYADFIHYYAKKGNVKECLKYMDVMRYKGIPCNIYIYNILLDCSLKYPHEEGRIQPYLRELAANNSVVFDEVSRNIQLSRFKISSNEDIFRSVDGFGDLLEQIIYNDGHHLSTRTYNTILQASGQFYKSKTTLTTKGLGDKLDNMIAFLDTSNLKPDIYTYALRIRNAAYLGDMEKAERIFKTMNEDNIKPNAYVFSHLIYGYAKKGELKTAEQMLQLMSEKHQLKPSAINYAPLIQGYAEAANYDKVYETYRAMLNRKIEPDIVIYTILAGVFLQQQYSSRFTHRGSSSNKNRRIAIDLLEGITKNGISMDVAALTLTAEAYALDAAAIIQDCLQVQKPFDDAIIQHAERIDGIYQQLKDLRWLDDKAITTLFICYYHLRKPEGAWRMWNELLTERHVKFSAYHYNALLTNFTASRTWFPMANVVFKEMEKHPIAKPDKLTFDVMLWGAYQHSNYTSLRKIWESPLRDKSSPLLVRNYYAVIHTALMNDDIDTAKGAYREYCQLESSPDITTVWINQIKALAFRYDLERTTTAKSETNAKYNITSDTNTNAITSAVNVIH
ncbi:hypothetical protein BDF20DRAFT_840535 [Mycotypha africana]|uniref:uncharacterized protein n=1 Tax=Mycotypha africana TaxID=64632 RepID=UPI0023016A5D|nr:uncharacterized protein BDF20DRAFT_840535 [Mycotypha africana]KAI8967001.1 hypothetical protein BDF20DRAFT_840535 [Mycotypha africana]